MRIVIKVGTSTLAHSTGLLNIKRVEQMCKVISDLKNAGVTLEQLSEELDYIERNVITEAREGWDDDLYLYSTEELEDAEELWDEVA